MTTFKADQYEDAYPQGIERYFWHIARNAIIARYLRRSELDTKSLLEIGCGRGIVIEYLRARGIDCIGCELAHVSVPVELRGFVHAETDFADLAAEHRNRVEGVLLCDVIEHLTDPVAFLRGVREKLPALTGILVTAPARQELWSEWDRHYGHFRRYDLPLLRKTLAQAGFKPQHAGYFFHSLYPPALLLRGGKLRSTSIKAPSAAGLHRIVGKAFQIEEMLLPSGFPGTSAIMTAFVG